jgi:hypothetical protein
MMHQTIGLSSVDLRNRIEQIGEWKITFGLGNGI